MLLGNVLFLVWLPSVRIIVTVLLVLCNGGGGRPELPASVGYRLLSVAMHTCTCFSSPHTLCKARPDDPSTFQPGVISGVSGGGVSSL